MEEIHPSINIDSDGIINREEMNRNGRGLSNTNGATTSLMNNSGIPMLGEKENPRTELKIETSSTGNNLNNKEGAKRRRASKRDRLRNLRGRNATTNEEEIPTERGSLRSNEIHFSIKLTEDNSRFKGILKNA